MGGFFAWRIGWYVLQHLQGLLIFALLLHHQFDALQLDIGANLGWFNTIDPVVGSLCVVALVSNACQHQINLCIKFGITGS